MEFVVGVNTEIQTNNGRSSQDVEVIWVDLYDSFSDF